VYISYIIVMISLLYRKFLSWKTCIKYKRIFWVEGPSLIAD